MLASGGYYIACAAGEEAILEVGNYSYYEWFNNEGILLDTMSTLTVSDSGIFYVLVIDKNGCEDISDPAFVSTQPRTLVLIPNSFTPNGDYHNDLFKVTGIFIKKYFIQIFNRWGELMFESNNINKSWDGTYNHTLVPEGLYYYHIKVIGEDNIEVNYNGNINIIN